MRNTVSTFCAAADIVDENESNRLLGAVGLMVVRHQGAEYPAIGGGGSTIRQVYRLRMKCR